MKANMLILAVLLVGAVIVVRALPYGFFSEDDLVQDNITIQSETGKHVFEIEVAVTQKAKETGLMYRKTMDANAGMLFNFSPPQKVSMWMKNTYLALDILFIDNDNQIIKIFEKAPPLSLDMMSCEDDVTKVLELKAGTVARFKIKEGDIIFF